MRSSRRAPRGPRRKNFRWGKKIALAKGENPCWCDITKPARKRAGFLELLTGFEPVTSSLPRYNPKQKGHRPPQNTPFKSTKHHNILCFFFPRISLAVSPFPNLTAKYSQSRFHAVFPRFFPPFKLPVSAPLLRGFYSRKSTSNKGSPIAFLTAIY